jgi:hypothetical protein
MPKFIYRAIFILYLPVTVFLINYFELPPDKGIWTLLVLLAILYFLVSPVLLIKLFPRYTIIFTVFFSMALSIWTALEQTKLYARVPGTIGNRPVVWERFAASTFWGSFACTGIYLLLFVSLLKVIQISKEKDIKETSQ